MKKFCALVLAALMLVPALAMAAKVPYETLKPSEIVNWENVYISPLEDVLKYTVTNEDGVTDTFEYNFSGVMKRYTRSLGGPSYVNYTPAGEISENEIGEIPPRLAAYDAVTANKNTSIAPAELSTLLREKGLASLEDFQKGGLSADDIVISGNTFEVKVDHDWVAAGKRNTRCNVLTAVDGSYTTENLAYILVGIDDVITAFSCSSGTPKLYKVFADSLCYYAGEDEGYTHVRNDKTYTDARYSAEGDRERYFLYSSDLTVKTAYDDKNRLRSHETWTADKAYWCYYCDEDSFEYYWEKDWETAEPTEEVLKTLMLTPVVAEYDVGTPLTSASQLDTDNKGLPFIVTSDAGLSDATVNITTTLDSLTKTTFNVTPTSDSGETVQPAAGTSLYLPLPNGMDAATAQDFGLTVYHEGEVFSTIDGTAKITDNGVLVNATSYSPYSVIWGAEATQVYNANAGKTAAKLPQTGDNSHAMIWLALLALCGAALAGIGLRKKTA